MRNLTEGEVYYWYNKQQWPCCRGNSYLSGPSGCGFRNVECPDCGMRINVLDPEGSGGSFFPQIGQVIRESSKENYVSPTPPLHLVQKIKNFFKFQK